MRSGKTLTDNNKSGNGRAEARRLAVRSILASRNLTISRLADLANVSPNAIGNFLAGRTSSLNLDTAEPMARVLGVSLNELFGDDAWQTVQAARIYLKGSVASGRWSDDYLQPREEWIEFAVPHQSKYAGKSFLMRLETNEMDQLWPAGTILEVVNLADFAPATLAPGNKVIALRRGASGHETICREIAGCDDSTACYLVARSTDPQYAKIMQIAFPIMPGDPNMLPNGDSVEVKAVVIRSIREEI